MRRATRIDHPQLKDGAAMWRIARDCGLDLNSPYKYLLFCRDFAASSAIAYVGGEPGAFVSGYVRPGSSVLFVWQIGVLDDVRKQGLATTMLHFLRERSDPPLTHLEATVTPANVASRRLFERFAIATGAACEEEVLFSPELFPEPHDAEILLRIGPLAPPGAGPPATTSSSTNDATRKGAPGA